MKSRLLGLVLLGIAAAGFLVVLRHAAAAQPIESELWELLLALVCVPAAVVGGPLLVFGAALFQAPVRIGSPSRRRRRSGLFGEIR